jgi:hypothetical protein
MFSSKGRDLMKEGEIQQATIYLKRALNCDPFNWRNLARLVRSYLRLVPGRTKRDSRPLKIT